MRSIVPTAGNMLIGNLKGTSIVSVPAVHDLLYSVQLVHNQTYQVIPLLMVATLWYIAVATVLSAGQFYVERHYAYAPPARCRSRLCRGSGSVWPRFAPGWRARPRPRTRPAVGGDQ